MLLDEPTEGEIFIGGRSIAVLRRNMQELRKTMQIIFQDPYSSLNPRKTVGDIIGAPFLVHKQANNKKEAGHRALELMEEVGLRPEHFNRYPHEFSGGQRQRIGIARALALRPKLIICDEPTSALDVSIQAQVINLLQDLQVRHKLTYLFISHDLSVVEHISNRIAVMYLGRIVEIAPSETLYQHPKHPYTRALVAASPVPDPTIKRDDVVLSGDVPSPINPPPGCHFHKRCPNLMEACNRDTPNLVEVAPGHSVRCFLYSNEL
jgi:oligopeptide/dipeptide ABC transporter ATP-binding protein